MCCVCNGSCNHVGPHYFCAAHGGSPYIPTVHSFPAQNSSSPSVAYVPTPWRQRAKRLAVRLKTFAPWSPILVESWCEELFMADAETFPPADPEALDEVMRGPGPLTGAVGGDERIRLTVEWDRHDSKLVDAEAEQIADFAMTLLDRFSPSVNMEPAPVED